MKVKRKYYYMYYNLSSNNGQFRHPVIEIFNYISKDYRFLGNNILKFSGQTDKENGHGLFRSYGWDMVIKLGSNDYNEATTVLKKYKHSESKIKAVLQLLHKIKAERLFQHEIKDADMAYCWVPWKYPKKAEAWVVAHKAELI